MLQNSILKKIRFLLVPFSIIYGGIVMMRNFFYDKGIFKSNQFSVPIIAVGNLSVGGTGKSPQIEYLVRLLESDFKIAILSRGYKRQSEGFVLATKHSTVEELGDEPFQFYTNFSNLILAVDANRTNGITQLLALHPEVDAILLDDAYQHRKVKASFYTLLTSYGNLYSDDYFLPVGTLRESRSGAKRAGAIVVTKCPENLSEEAQQTIIASLKPKAQQPVFFTSIRYADTINSETEKISIKNLKNYQLLVVTGIANPKPLLDYMKNLQLNFQHLNYPDHYNFKEKDLFYIKKTFDEIPVSQKLIITTQKDFVRLNGKLNSLFYLGIETAFLKDKLIFDTLVKKQLG